LNQAAGRPKSAVNRAGEFVYFAANLSMLFSDLPLQQRFAAAAAAGFRHVEVQFPYELSIAQLQQCVSGAGVSLEVINVPPGDISNGDVGLACLPLRVDEFRGAVAECLSYAKALKVKKINCLAGRPQTGQTAVATKTLIANLRYAADIFAKIDATVMVEPVNPTDVPGFLINRLRGALDVIRRVERPNVKLQFDLYHMAQTEPDLDLAIARAGNMIGHVQFADAPGRHEPGSGGIDFRSALDALRTVGYDGCVAAEYWPAGATHAGLGWRQDFEKWVNPDGG